MKKMVVMKVAKGATGVAALGALATSAHAELPTEVTAAFTTISTNYDALAAAAWPVIGTVVGGFILVKLFKKFANKAT